MYNVGLAIEAQNKYCRDNDVPHFAPRDGYCYRCGHQIYAPTETKYGYTIGVSVEEASTSLVTGCPYCNASYCD